MQQPLSPIKVLQPRGQCITLLLAALADLGGSLTKREVIKFIDENRWFAKQTDDWKPYPSQSEPRWHTLIAWGRKDSVLRDIVLNNELMGIESPWQTRMGIGHDQVFYKRMVYFQRLSLVIKI